MSTNEIKPDTPRSGDSPEKKKQGFRKNQQNVTRSNKFEGRCEDLKGHVYDYGESKNADQFVQTTKEIKNYVGRIYKNPGDITTAITAMAITAVVEPAEPDDPDNKIEMKKWENEYNEYRKSKKTLEDNVKSLFNLVWGQCTDSMQQKIESLDNYTVMEAENNGIALLLAIKNTSYNYQSQKYRIEAINEALYRLMTLRQNQSTPQQYHEQFTNMLAVYVHCGGSTEPDPGSMEYVAGINNWVAPYTAEQKASVREMGWANWFVLHADRNRYGSLITDLQNNFLTNRDNYPKTLNDAYSRLANWKDPLSSIRNNGPSSVAFTNIGSSNSSGSSSGSSNNSGNKKSKDHITCFNCKQKGHYSNQCTNPKVEEGTTNITIDNGNNNTGTTLVNQDVHEGAFDDTDIVTSFAFICSGHSFNTASSSKHIPDTWVLLDNQSTIDVFSNPSLLMNIKSVNRSMSIYCNAGVTKTTQVGTLPGYGEVWYHPTGIANILSFSRVRAKGFNITYNNKTDSFNIKGADTTEHTFKKSYQGLYYLDTATNERSGSVFITTVANNKSKYSQRDYNRAVEARKLLCKIGRPSHQTFLRILERNLIPNCPVTRRDAMNAEAIFGPDLGSLKGKTVRKPSTPVLPVLNDLPPEIMLKYREVTLVIDIFSVNKNHFFISRSRHIQYTTVSEIPNHEQATLLGCMTQIQKIYSQRGFVIRHIIADGEFEHLRIPLAGLHMSLNTCSKDEHVPDIERHIRTLKERTRAIYTMLPFKKMPDRLVIEMVYASNFWLNSFPPINGISDFLSPRTIVTGGTINFTDHCQIEFGAYAQVHEAHDNTMTTRTVGAIALRPTGNAQGGYFFYSLDTGRVLNRNRWTELPMPADVVTRIHTLARRNPRGMKFSNRHHVPFVLDPDSDEIDDDDSTFVPDDDVSAGVDADNDDDDGADDDEADDSDSDDDDDDVDINDAANADNDVANVADHDIHEDIDNSDDDNTSDGTISVAADVQEVEQDDDDTSDTSHNDDDNENDDNINDPPIIINNNYVENAPAPQPTFEETYRTLEHQMDEAYGPRITSHNLRPRKPRDYGHLHTTLEHIALTQYSVKKGLQIFGEAGVEAVLKELKQLHDRTVIEPVNADKLTLEEKQGALAYLMFLKEKRTGEIKGRGCADGRKQRTNLTKEETSSPTVAIESVMISGTIDAYEKRDVATIDVPGAFMQADMDDTVYIRIDGAMAELLIRIDPTLYNQFVKIVNGKKVLYLLLKKALYGTLKAALLFYKKLVEVLTSWGFELNPYDPCVANKMINGKQCTILWHVDDLKISHEDPAEVTKIIEMMSAEFGKEAPLTVRRGTIHDYLGMNLDFSEEGVLKVGMTQYIENILKEMPEDMAGESPTPAANHLFDVNPNQVPLNDTKKEFFHHVVAQLLFLCKRARPDIQTAISYLCTRVTNPSEDDYKKLTRVIRYLRGTVNMPLRLEADSLNVVKWWVDASYGVHPDLKSHTGGIMSMGKGAVYGTSTRQKLNTKSSTEAELVGVAEVLPQVLWTRYFIEAQGYTCTSTIIHQDNKSSILLEENGMASSSKRTRHINIRYYFVTDRIAKGEVSISYCPTKEMIADFFTKPLQGQLFVYFRDYVMNVASSNDDKFWKHRSVLNVIYMDDRSAGNNDEHRSADRNDEGGFTLVTRKRRINKEGHKVNKSKAGKVSEKSNESVKGHGTIDGHNTKKDQYVKNKGKAHSI